MDEPFLSVSDTRKYIREKFGVSWTGYWIRVQCKRGNLRFIQPGGDRGWIYVEKASIDERFAAPVDRSE